MGWLPGRLRVCRVGNNYKRCWAMPYRHPLNPKRSWRPHSLRVWWWLGREYWGCVEHGVPEGHPHFLCVFLVRNTDASGLPATGGHWPTAGGQSPAAGGWRPNFIGWLPVRPQGPKYLDARSLFFCFSGQETSWCKIGDSTCRGGARMHWKRGGIRPPCRASAYAQPLSPSPTPTASFHGICDRQ